MVDANEWKKFQLERIGFVGLGRALSTALHMSTFPQSTLKFDKRKLWTPLASNSDKVDELPANILNDIKAGLKFEHSEKKSKFSWKWMFSDVFQII